MKKFYCYSPRLKNELKQLGYTWIDTGKHNTTKRIFWVYKITTELKQYLDDRKDNK